MLFFLPSQFFFLRLSWSTWDLMFALLADLKSACWLLLSLCGDNQDSIAFHECLHNYYFFVYIRVDIFRFSSQREKPTFYLYYWKGHLQISKKASMMITSTCNCCVAFNVADFRQQYPCYHGPHNAQLLEPGSAAIHLPFVSIKASKTEIKLFVEIIGKDWVQCNNSMRA